MIGRYGVKGLLLAVTVIVGSIVALQTWLPPTGTPASVPPSSTTPDSVKSGFGNAEFYNVRFG